MNFSTTLSASKARFAALLAVAMLCLMTLFGVSSASAHDELVATTPKQGAVLETSPKEFVLSFSGALKQIGTIINLKDSTGEAVETTFTISGRDLKVVPVSPLGNGEYSLVTRVVSSDGHPIDKKLEFSVKDPQAVASAAPSPEASVAPSSEASVAPSSAPAPEQSANPAAPEAAKGFGSLPTAVIWVLVGVVVIGSIVMVLAKTRRTGK